MNDLAFRNPMDDLASVRTGFAPGPAQEHRMRAAMELLRHIPVRAPRRIAAVYKERGPMRALLAHRFPHAEIEAFDLSAFDLSRPKGTGRDAAGGRLGAAHTFDLLCLNGAGTSLRRLLPMLIGMVAVGGCLAAGFPNDLYEPNRALMRMIAADGPWAKTLVPIAKTRPFNETMEGLYALLSPSCAKVDIWEATYLHVMESVAAVVAWMEATRLAPFLAVLDEADRRRFVDRYAAELNEAYEALPNGGVLLRSRQLFVLAQR
jgi:trans-aconitate 2-methyltransferase